MKITVNVKARASENKLFKNSDGTFTACLTAPPVNGEANRSLIELLSEEFNIAKSYIEIVKGAHSKTKIVSIGE